MALIKRILTKQLDYAEYWIIQNIYATETKKANNLYERKASGNIIGFLNADARNNGAEYFNNPISFEYTYNSGSPFVPGSDEDVISITINNRNNKEYTDYVIKFNGDYHNIPNIIAVIDELLGGVYGALANVPDNNGMDDFIGAENG